ncbi:penicillin-binding protein, beta-lactamase class C (plasmid) [Salipiger profundus]|uniref:Penicillin-binding protein, beta-lactamase class C n=2 Tax=Roseobacteraceae TaxID=2854170 RepID=A0A1U7DD43_9RHOB|nr:penicillin-binding protein, beta-lactamase class C [Salipiger profundus]
MFVVLAEPVSAQDMALDASTLRAALDSFDVPGIAVAMLADCAPMATVEAGLADVAAGDPVTRDTAFEAASLSKPVFAHIVLQLADEGVIDLDRPIAEIMPYPRITDAQAYARITPRMVLTHRTGLPNWAEADGSFRSTAPIAFDTPPGTAYTYSGEGFELLRTLVERETGQSLAALFEARLGILMPHSSFAGLPEGAAPSRGYVSARDPGEGRALSYGGAAGGLVTTASDYAAFLGYVCREEGLSAAMQADMLRPQSPVPPGLWSGPASWGLGWAVVQMGPETIVAHDGNNGAYRALAGFLPATGQGFVFLSNGRNGGDLIEQMG